MLALPQAVCKTAYLTPALATPLRLSGATGATGASVARPQVFARRKSANFCFVLPAITCAASAPGLRARNLAHARTMSLNPI